MNLPDVRNVFSHVARRWRLLFYERDVEQEPTHELRQHLEMEARGSRSPRARRHRQTVFVERLPDP